MTSGTLAHNYESYLIHFICSSAQVLSDARQRLYVIKPQQPSKGWDKIYGTAERAFDAIAEHYQLQPHRRGRFKSCTFGWTMGQGSQVSFDLSRTIRCIF
jgi:hypothetical protein